MHKVASCMPCDQLSKPRCSDQVLRFGSSTLLGFMYSSNGRPAASSDGCVQNFVSGGAMSCDAISHRSALGKRHLHACSVWPAIASTCQSSLERVTPCFSKAAAKSPQDLTNDSSQLLPLSPVFGRVPVYSCPPIARYNLSGHAPVYSQTSRSRRPSHAQKLGDSIIIPAKASGCLMVMYMVAIAPKLDPPRNRFAGEAETPNASSAQGRRLMSFAS
mmetsp:Transcript_16741/g.38688  ORF Transcript_16741/g.38688 Transcript_16741/m.38688 type:complete len:217 (+) Transcript_16741:216-866(+)